VAIHCIRRAVLQLIRFRRGKSYVRSLSTHLACPMTIIFPQMEQATVFILVNTGGQASDYWLSRGEPLCYHATYNHLNEELPRWRCATGSQ
jgi:hypothetical protein